MSNRNVRDKQLMDLALHAMRTAPADMEAFWLSLDEDDRHDLECCLEQICQSAAYVNGYFGARSMSAGPSQSRFHAERRYRAVRRAIGFT